MTIDNLVIELRYNWPHHIDLEMYPEYDHYQFLTQFPRTFLIEEGILSPEGTPYIWLSVRDKTNGSLLTQCNRFSPEYILEIKNRFIDWIYRNPNEL